MGFQATGAARKDKRASNGYQRQNGGKARKPVAE
tara:strand:+ start:166 stop:267 length:102 start_codon:yes stop_codon:yes gene_type:complete